MNDRELGQRALQLYYFDSDVQFAMSFQDVVSWYTSKELHPFWSPDVLGVIGKAVRTSQLGEDAQRAAFRRIDRERASDGDPRILPHYTAYGLALAGTLSGFRFENVKAAAKGAVTDTVATVKGAALAGAGLYLLYLAGGLALTLLVTSGRSTRRGAT